MGDMSGMMRNMGQMMHVGHDEADVGTHGTGDETDKVAPSAPSNGA
jgi:hypothetical protein